MAIDRESNSSLLEALAAGDSIVPPLPRPKAKPLDAHVARAAANNLILNVLNLNFEIREIVVAQGISFHNADMDKEVTLHAARDPSVLRFRKQREIPESLLEDFPDIVIQDADHAVFISDVQRVEFRIRVVTTKDAFKQALQTPGIHVIYSGHSRFGRGACFGPDIQFTTDDQGKPKKVEKGDDWERGTNPVTFGIYRMGFPFVGVPFKELDEHEYHTRPVPSTVRVNPADVDPLTVAGSLRPLILRGSRFERLIENLPVVDSYWGCQTVDGPGVLLFADFQNTGDPLNPDDPVMDLGATDLQCRCISLLGCDTLKHFRPILRNRKGFKRTETEGFAYFTTDVTNSRLDRLYVGSLFEFPQRNDFQSWFPALEFAVERTNAKLAAARERYRMV